MKNRIETIVYSKLKMLEIQQVIANRRMKDVSQNYQIIPLSKLQLWAKINNLQLASQKLDYISAHVGTRNDYKILNLLVQDRYEQLSIDEIERELGNL